MDKKIRNRIIYVTVAGLWSIAIYRTYKNYQVKKENEELKVMTQPSMAPIQFEKDTFELDLPTKDPFLGNGWTPNNKADNPPISNKEKVEIKKIVEQPIQKKWPKIEYFGFVKNREKNNPLCLLKIDGQQIHLSKGQTHNGILVVNTFKDSVMVIYESEKRIIKK